MIFDGHPASHRAVNRLDVLTKSIVKSEDAREPIFDSGDGSLCYERQAGSLALTGGTEGALMVFEYGSPNAKWRSVISYLFAGKAPNVHVFLGQNGAEPPAEIRFSNPSDPHFGTLEQRALNRGEARLVTRDLMQTYHQQQIEALARSLE